MIFLFDICSISSLNVPVSWCLLPGECGGLCRFKVAATGILLRLSGIRRKPFLHRGLFIIPGDSPTNQYRWLVKRRMCLDALAAEYVCVQGTVAWLLCRWNANGAGEGDSGRQWCCLLWRIEPRGL